MPKKAILHVESRPAVADVEEFGRWYDEVHIPEVLAIEGFVSARRYAPTEDGGPFVSQYEIEGDPQAAVARLSAAAGEGRLDMSGPITLDPPPKMHILELVTDTASG